MKWVSIGSENGLSPGQNQAIIWTSAGILSTGLLGTNFSEIRIGILSSFGFKKMHLKLSSTKMAAILSRGWVKVGKFTTGLLGTLHLVLAYMITGTRTYTRTHIHLQPLWTANASSWSLLLCMCFMASSYVLSTPHTHTHDEKNVMRYCPEQCQWSQGWWQVGISHWTQEGCQLDWLTVSQNSIFLSCDKKYNMQSIFRCILGHLTFLITNAKTDVLIMTSLWS